MAVPTESTRNRGTGRKTPRAIIHKQILDRAAADPEASMEAIADAVSGATTETVERVLAEYGDPAADDADATDATTDGESESLADAVSDETTTAADDATDSPADEPPSAATGREPSEAECAVTDGGAASEATDDSATETPATTERDADREPDPEPVLDWSSLTEKQRETLRAIHDHPDATQADLADLLGVSSPTISQRVNSIDGFDWSNRHALVAPLFASDGGDEAPETETETDRSPPRRDDTATDAGSSGTGTENGDGTELDRSAEATDESADGQRLAALADRIDELAERLAAVERKLEAGSRGRERDREAVPESGVEPSVLDDPELAHKIVHACMCSDRISEEEELRLLRDVTVTGGAAESNANANSTS